MAVEDGAVIWIMFFASRGSNKYFDCNLLPLQTVLTPIAPFNNYVVTFSAIVDQRSDCTKRYIGSWIYFVSFLKTLWLDVILKLQLFGLIIRQLRQSVRYIPFPNKPCFFMCLQYKSFENSVGKGRIAHNEQFFLSEKCFLPV